jgi:hypothetical protein
MNLAYPALAPSPTTVAMREPLRTVRRLTVFGFGVGVGGGVSPIH